jgi:calcineurin-like phosphoesterase family protein
MSKVFFTSDTHYGHSNIASKNTSRWKEGYRNYNSLEEMNQNIVKSINEIVGPDDVLYHLGDWSFGGKNNIWDFRKQLSVKEIHLILGNHDHHIEKNIIIPNSHVLTGNDGKLEVYDGFSNEDFPTLSVNLFSSVSHYKEINHHGQVIVLSHYPFAVWHGNGKGWWHLHGHCHDSFNSIGKSLDVGIDSAIRLLGEPRPFSFNEIIDIMDKKQLKLLDHHDVNTNTGKRPK